VVAPLGEVRMADAFQKFRTRAVSHMLERRLAEEGIEYDFVGTGFTNGSPLLGARITLADGAQIGWQLQGEQWRRFLIVPEHLQGKDEALKSLRIAYADQNHSGWFRFSEEERLGRFAGAPSSDYKHYSPGFVYDYIRVPGMTVRQVVQFGVLVMRAAYTYQDSLGPPHQ